MHFPYYDTASNLAGESLNNSSTEVSKPTAIYHVKTSVSHGWRSFRTDPCQKIYQNLRDAGKNGCYI